VNTLLDRRSVLAGLAAAPLLSKYGMARVGHSGRRLPAPAFFVKAVWQQPSSLFSKWLGRGINVVDFVPGGSDATAWTLTAASAGLPVIKLPNVPSSSDTNASNILAWSMPDEPDNVSGLGLTYGQVAADPEAIRAMADGLVAGSGTIPIICNLVGNHLTNRNQAPIIFDYLNIPGIDWWASDSYQVQDGHPFLLTWNGYTSTHQGYALDLMSFYYGATPLSAAKPKMQAIGTSDFNGVGRVPTPGQFRAMAWSAIIHGAFGLVYFPIVLKPAFAWDGTPPNLLSEMHTLHSAVDGIADILINSAHGGRLPSTLRRCANKDSAPIGLQLPYPFEGCEIPTAQAAYKIVLNLVDETTILNDSRWGLSGLSFYPYEVKYGYALS
jgi:hypothetical protein